jgi:hypothetical protein
VPTEIGVALATLLLDQLRLHLLPVVAVKGVALNDHDDWVLDGQENQALRKMRDSAPDYSRVSVPQEGRAAA